MTYNQEQKHYLETTFGRSLKEIDDSELFKHLVSMFKCNKCGSFVELSSLRKNNFDVDTAKCRSCSQADYFEDLIQPGSDTIGGVSVSGEALGDNRGTLPIEEENGK